MCPTSCPHPKDIQHKVMQSRKSLILGLFCVSLPDKLWGIFYLGARVSPTQTQRRRFQPDAPAEIPSQREPALPHRSDHLLITTHLWRQCILLYADEVSGCRSQSRGVRCSEAGCVCLRVGRLLSVKSRVEAFSCQCCKYIQSVLFLTAK